MSLGCDAFRGIPKYIVAAVGWEALNSSQQAYRVGDQLNRPPAVPQYL